MSLNRTYYAYLMHSRTKGSRNGFSKNPDYKPVGTPAKGIWRNGRYIYNFGNQIGNTVRNGFETIRSNVNQKVEPLKRSISAQDAYSRALLEDKPLREVEAAYRDVKATKQSPANPKKKDSKNFVMETLRSNYKIGPLIRAGEAAGKAVSDAIRKSNDEEARKEGFKDDADRQRHMIEEAQRWKEYTESDKYKENRQEFLKKKAQREKYKEAFIKERKEAFDKQWAKDHKAKPLTTGEKFVKAAVGSIVGSGDILGDAAVRAKRGLNYEVALSDQMEAWEEGYDSMDDFYNGKRSKKYTGW